MEPARNAIQTTSAPLVTVAMVTYNSGAFVRAAIDSVLASSLKEFELLISDDNSRDDTWEIVQTYRDPRIVAIRNAQNLGEYANRNQCVTQARGKYLLFIDGDDMIYPHGLAFMTKMLEAFPDCGMALMRWYKKNIFYPVSISPRQFYQGIYFNYGFNDIAFANTFFRTEALRRAGGLTQKYRAGDCYIRMQIALTDRVLLISDGLTWWRETPNQASSRLNNAAGISEHMDMYFEMLAHPDCPLDEEEKKAAVRNLRKSVSAEMMGLLRARRFADFNALRSRYKIGFSELAAYRSGQIYKDPFEGYTPMQPCMIDFSQQPFASDSSWAG